MSDLLQTVVLKEPSVDFFFKGIYLSNTFSYSMLFSLPTWYDCLCSGEWGRDFLAGCTVVVGCGDGESVRRALGCYSACLFWDIVLYGINSLLLTVHITYYGLVFYVTHQECLGEVKGDRPPISLFVCFFTPASV
jgi:hypothetical protein